MTLLHRRRKMSPTTVGEQPGTSSRSSPNPQKTGRKTPLLSEEHLIKEEQPMVVVEDQIDEKSQSDTKLLWKRARTVSAFSEIDVLEGKRTVSESELFLKKHMSMPRKRELVSEQAKCYLKEFFHKEDCVYSHNVFKKSARVFNVLKNDFHSETTIPWQIREQRLKEDIIKLSDIEYGSLYEKRLTFNLVFSTLKFQKFLEDMLEDCSFFHHFPEYEEEWEMVMTVLCDYQLRKFQLRNQVEEEELDEHLSEIEQALYGSRTKLGAALARSRIKARVLTVDHLLPENVREIAKFANRINCCCWVNLIKTSVSEVIEQLTEEGFTQVFSEDRVQAKCFYNDHHCPDLLQFSGEMRHSMELHDLVLDGHLVIQDKSSCIGPQSIRNLINVGDDILHVNLGSGATTAHIASLTHGSESLVYAFGISNDIQEAEVNSNLDRLGALSRVKVINENFMDVDSLDERLKHIKVVLMTAECSRSGVANPVDFIVNEGEDIAILKDLSVGKLEERRLGELVVKHSASLRHALKFPRVQAVVYCTRSILEAENENVIVRSIEHINQQLQKKLPFRITPPVLPLTDHDIESESPLSGKYLKFQPSTNMSGCFVATITREADDPKEAAKDILARAAARGIISGVPTVQARSKTKVKVKKEKVKKEEKKTASAGAIVAAAKGARKGVSSGVNLGMRLSQPITPRPHSSMAIMAELPHATASTSATGGTTITLRMQNLVGSPLLTSSSGQLSPTKLSPRRPPQPAHKEVIQHPAPFR